MENNNQQQPAATAVVLEPKSIKLLKSELPQLQALLGLNAKKGSDVATMAMQELEYLRMQMVVKPFIADCLPSTVVMAVKYCLKNNLSLDPNANLVYLMPISVKINNKWENALEIKPTAEGHLSINYQCGKILDHKRPVVKKTQDGKVIEVTVEFLFPGHGSPRWEAITFDESDFERWRKFSHKKNGRNKADADDKKLNYANALYTSFKGGIDPEFARSKSISHGLKKRGVNMNEMSSMNIQPTNEPKTIVVEDQHTETESQPQPSNDHATEFEEANIVSESVKVTAHEIIDIPNANDL